MGYKATLICFSFRVGRAASCTDGAYWTGYVHRDDTLWPEEKPTWTAAAVMLAADALSNKTGAAHLFRNEIAVSSTDAVTRANQLLD